jgi:hypothetical protein
MILVKVFPGSEAVEVFKQESGCLITFVCRYMPYTAGLELLECFFGDGLLGLTGCGNLFSKLEVVLQGGLLVGITACLLLKGGFLKVIGGWENGPNMNMTLTYLLSIRGELQ